MKNFSRHYCESYLSFVEDRHLFDMIKRNDRVIGNDIIHIKGALTSSSLFTLSSGEGGFAAKVPSVLSKGRFRIQALHTG